MDGSEAGVSATPALDHRRQALLAVGVAEYQSTYDALYALWRMGVEVPHGILSRIRLEQRLLMTRWQREFGSGSVAVTTDNWGEIVTACRVWLAEHSDHINTYLEGR